MHNEGSNVISRRQLLVEDWKHTLYLWRQNKLAMVGTVLVAFFILIAIFAPLIAPYDPIEVDLSRTLLPPSSEHIFGTDQFGRDIFSRVVYGARIEVGIILLVTVISGTIGLAVGITAGYFGGVIDDVLMRITDVFLSFPNLILAMALSAMLGRGVFNAIIAISLVGWTIIARLARAESMKIKSLPYIEAIRALGASNIRILLLHILPMCMSPVLVQLSLRMGSIILTAAGLGFLGLGAQPPTPEWGAIVSDGRSYLVEQWWISTFPGLFIALVVLGFNLLGDGIRDMMDPRIRR
ncbi:peptide/nickel transport system permease protein [Acetomicrobium thermoterrenum DSM 13490]|uniref:Peptide/nickel transport system permease protein n=1 Tax=Acetomicrobium thermoterrenum DSM 13490 TaxID=1120987 RepID=A0A1H3EN54_9BACT|nr:ABC transporter permease [Acetomicrobium thermoterrenum]SDX79987.1 peptide/nickel transport system permease protein [Acetomicrobium thermoterrenum DSM 13490]